MLSVATSGYKAKVNALEAAASVSCTTVGCPNCPVGALSELLEASAGAAGAEASAGAAGAEASTGADEDGVGPEASVAVVVLGCVEPDAAESATTFCELHAASVERAATALMRRTEAKTDVKLYDTMTPDAMLEPA